VSNPDDTKAALKVAAVARRSGVSVRTLHYYEEIGLLEPSGRTRSGHRLYTPADIQRLLQIRSLQQLGLSLAEVGDCLAGGRIEPLRVVRDHLAKVQEQRSALERVERQLERLAQQLARGGLGDAQTTETLLNALEVITMYEHYFTNEQLERLEAHASRDQDAVAPVIEQLEAARQRGTPPGDAAVQRLWQRFQEAVSSVAGGDPEMSAAIYKLLHAEPKAREDHGISDELFAYLGSIAGGPEHRD